MEIYKSRGVYQMPGGVGTKKRRMKSSCLWEKAASLSSWSLGVVWENGKRGAGGDPWNTFQIPPHPVNRSPWLHLTEEGAELGELGNVYPLITQLTVESFLARRPVHPCAVSLG